MLGTKLRLLLGSSRKVTMKIVTQSQERSPYLTLHFTLFMFQLSLLFSVADSLGYLTQAVKTKSYDFAGFPFCMHFVF